MVDPRYRAKVVGSLRALAVADKDVSDGEFLDILFDLVLDYNEPRSDAHFLDSLADLIERKTTKWLPQDPDDARPKYLCDVCKTSIGHMLWSYCPRCGAEIVR